MKVKKEVMDEVYEKVCEVIPELSGDIIPEWEYEDVEKLVQSILDVLNYKEKK